MTDGYNLQLRFHAGAGGGAQAPKLWLGPKFSRTLDTLSTESQKISKFDATRCQILRLKCTKI